MKRVMALVLAAAFVSIFCLAGSLKAQRESRVPALEKSPAKVSESEGGQHVESPRERDALERDARMEKARQAYVAKLEKQLDELKIRKRNLRDEQRSLREDIFKQCGMSPENVVPSLLNIEREILIARIDRAAKHGSRGALSNQVAEATAIAQKYLEADEILKNLESLVNDKAEALKSLQRLKETGMTSAAAVKTAEAELREAEIRTAARKEELTKGNGEAGAFKLNILVQENSVSIIQTEARLEVLLKEREKLSAVRNLVDAYNDITDGELPTINRLIDRLSEKFEDEKLSR
jgi:hypothetical protein